MEYQQSNSTESQNVSSDLLEYLNILVENKNNRTSEAFTDILVYCDATNGEVYIYWYDAKEQITDDESGYAIEFPELFELSNESDEGSFYFDKIISGALNKLKLSKEGQNILTRESVLFQDELEEPRKLK